MADAAQPTTRPVRAKKACVECRQQKARCDANSGACSRCQRLNLVCRISTDFKREHKRQRLDQLKNETDMLRQKLGAQDKLDSPTSTSDRPSGTGLVFNRQRSEGATNELRRSWPRQNEGMDERGFPVPEEQYNHSSQADNRSTLPRDLDDVHYEPAFIDELFAIYFRDFDHYLPVVNAAASPNQVWDRSKLLFWAIIAVASRGHRAMCAEDIEVVSDKVCDMAVTSLRTQIASFHSIKGLLLLLNWPLACSHPRRSVNHALHGSLLHLGMRIGLHVPASASDFAITVDLTESDIDNRTRLWGTCLVTYLRFCNWKGFSPLASLSSANGPDEARTIFQHLPKSVRLQLRLEELRVRAASALQQIGLGSTLSAHQESSMNILLGVFDSQIRDIALDALTELDRCYVNMTQVAVEMWHFFKHPSRLDPVTVAKMFISSSLLIKQLDSFPDNGINLRSCPTYFTFAALLAITNIGRMMKTSLVQFLDQKEGEATFLMGLSVVQRLSVEPEDIANRLGGVVERLWSDSNAFKDAEGNDLPLKVRSRLGTSAAYDALMTQIRKERNSSKQANSSSEGSGSQQGQDGSNMSFDDPFFQMIDLSFNDDFLFPAFVDPVDSSLFTQ